MPPHFTSWRSTLILFPHIRTWAPSRLFYSGLPAILLSPHTYRMPRKYNRCVNKHSGRQLVYFASAQKSNLLCKWRRKFPPVSWQMYTASRPRKLYSSRLFSHFFLTRTEQHCADSCYHLWLCSQGDTWGCEGRRNRCVSLWLVHRNV